MKPLFPLLVLLTAFPALSTDMYLPAMPTLQQIWHQPVAVVNLTLIGFFVTFCFALLVYGPVSDRFGRRPPLLTGVTLYITACLACAAAPDVAWLIVARVLQAAGAAAAAALALAITKDVYDGRQRARIIAHIAVILALAPMLAPIIGSWLLAWASWRWIFVIQGFMGAVALYGVWRMPETLPVVVASGAREVAAGYRRLFKNRRFMSITLTMSLLALPFFAFIAGSADMYINGFGLTARQFGYFFGFNATGIMFGPMLFSRLSHRVPAERLMSAGFAGVGIGGLFMVLGPGGGPWHLALCNWAMVFSFGLCRPPTNNLALEQVHRDAGSASSLLVFTYMLVGAGGMGLISLDWADKVRFLGVLGTMAGTLNLLFWLRFKHRFRPARPIPGP